MRSGCCRGVLRGEPTKGRTGGVSPRGYEMAAITSFATLT